MMLLGSDFKSKLKRKVEEDSSDRANPAAAGEEKGGLGKVGLRGAWSNDGDLPGC